MKLLRKSIIISMLLFAGISQGMISQEEQQPVDKLSAIANKKFDASMIIYSKHAIEQMTDRKIFAKHIENVIKTGDRKRDQNYPDTITFWEKCPERVIDKPYQLFVTGNPKGKNNEKLLIITAYFIDRIEYLSKSITSHNKQKRYLKRKQRKKPKKQIEESNKKEKSFEKGPKGGICEYLRMNY